MVGEGVWKICTSLFLSMNACEGFTLLLERDPSGEAVSAQWKKKLARLMRNAGQIVLCFKEKYHDRTTQNFGC